MRKTAACFADKVRQHLPCSFEVSNDAVEHRRDHGHATRFASVLLLCFSTDVDHFSGHTVNCNQRWLVDNDATTTHGDDRRCRSHVYSHRIGDEILQSAHSHNGLSLNQATKKHKRHKKHKISLIGRAPYSDRFVLFVPFVLFVAPIGGVGRLWD